MKLEHVAFNVADPHAHSAWYVQNLGMSIASQKPQAPFTTFLGDESGKMLLEMYNNPPDQVPDYANLNPLLLHVAFFTHDPAGDRARLVAAGATFVSETYPDTGTTLVMLRDPWGLPLQLCKRDAPMLKP